jgi:hypothetical protein
MEQDERTPRSPGQELTRRISLFEEAYEEQERTRRLELPSTPPWDTPESDAQSRVKRRRAGKHGQRPQQRWPMIVAAGLLGAVIGAVATLLVTGAMLQREVASRETRIAALSSELDQARAEQLAVSARGAELDQRAAVLDQRERELDERAAVLDRHERELDRRGQGRVRLPGIDLPTDGLSRGILDRLGQRIQDLLNEAIPSRPGN